MWGHPGVGWRGPCALLVCGLAGCAGGPQSRSVALREPAKQRIQIVLTAGAVQPPRRPSGIVSRPPAVRSAQAPVHVDVLASARQLEHEGRLPEASRAYQAVLQRYPQHVECLHRLAVVNTRMNDFETARTYYERALQLAPANVSLLIDAGYARYLAGDHRQAEKLLRQAITQSPKDVRATNNLGMVIGVSGRFNEALALFQQVNQPATAWTNLAYVHQLRREPEQALTCYQRARAIDSTVHVPEELLAQSAPVDSLVTEADLPPAPLGAPAQEPTTRTALRPAATMPPVLASEPLLTQQSAEPASAVEELPAPPDTSAALPIVTPAFEPERRESHQPFEDPRAAAPKGPVASLPATEDPFELPLEADRQPMLVAVEDAPAFAPDVQPAETNPFAETDNAESPFQTPLHVAAEPSPRRNSIEWAEAVFIDGEHAKLAARADQDGFKGFCLVTLFEERRLVNAAEEFAVEHKGQTYQFSSPDAAKRFKADPDHYVPAAGGLDVVAVRQGSDVVSGSLDYAVWYRDRLYLFSSQQHKNEFRASPRQFVTEK